MRSGSLIPGESSSCELASTAQGRTASIASRTFSGASLPASTRRPSTRRPARDAPGLLAPRADRRRGRPARRRGGAPRHGCDGRSRGRRAERDRPGRSSPTRTATESIVSGTAARARRGAALAGEDESGEVGARLGGGADVFLARQPADLDERAGEQLAKLPGRVVCPHERRADEHGVRSGELGRRCLSARIDAALGNTRPFRLSNNLLQGRLGDEVELRVPVDSKVEIAGVDPDRIRAEGEGPVELAGVVGFDERVEAEGASGGHQLRLAGRRDRGGEAGPRPRRFFSAASRRARGRSPWRGSAATLRRARPEVASDPPKRSSTSTESAAAPARSKSRASSPGSAPGRRSPAEGERRLISAIAARPGPASASGTHAPPPSRVNAISSSRRAPAAPESTVSVANRGLPEIARLPGRGDRARGVQEHGVAPSVRARRRAHLGGVLRGRPSAEVGRVAARDAEVERVDLASPHPARGDLADEVRPGGRELVDTGGAVHDERAVGAEPGERPAIAGTSSGE